LSFEELEASLRRGGFITRTLDALWPRPKPEQLVRRLLTNAEALAAAADGILDDEELRLAYRVPRQVLELALPLLPLIAPDVAAPIAYREGDEPPRFVPAAPEHFVATALREAGREAQREGRTALIAPAALVTELAPLLPGQETAFDELAAPIQVLTPRQARASSSTGSCWSSRRASSPPPTGSMACARSTFPSPARRRPSSSSTRSRSRPSSEKVLALCANPPGTKLESSFSVS
jgi:hypothetical protein